MKKYVCGISQHAFSNDATEENAVDQQPMTRTITGKRNSLGFPSSYRMQIQTTATIV